MQLAPPPARLLHNTISVKLVFFLRSISNHCRHWRQYDKPLKPFVVQTVFIKSNLKDSVEDRYVYITKFHGRFYNLHSNSVSQR